MNTLVKIIFGSHLYGTNTSESDQDFKGIFMPTKEEIFLGRIPKSIQNNTKTDCSNKNTSSDKDSELYSLHYFIKMACAGETATIDMLHAPPQNILITSNLWTDLVANRHRFYTKNLKALIGYARRQASKYGIKGSRLNESKLILDFIKDKDGRVKDYWDQLPSGEHIFKHPASELNNNIRMYEVCGRKIGETCSTTQLYDIVNIFYTNYGERAKKAAKDEGIDWKAVSHALRAAFQIREILTTNDLKFPLKEASLLKEIKLGCISFKEVQPLLDNLMSEVETLSEKSKLPDKVNTDWWDKWLVKKIEEYFNI